MNENYKEETYKSQGDKSNPSINWASDFLLHEKNIEEKALVTRSELASAIYSLCMKSSGKDLKPLGQTNFLDFSELSPGDQKGVLFVEANSLMQGYGDGRFASKDGLRVCELAQVLYNGRTIFSDLNMTRLFFLDPETIDYIEVMDGNTGKVKTIREEDQIKSLAKELNDFKFEKIEGADMEGWSLRIKLHFTSGKVLDASLSSDWLEINGVSYRASEAHFEPLIREIF